VNCYEVLVIGGGVVGSSVLYHLSQYQQNIALLEREPDVCEGTSKTNSAIVHTGFDATPGTLEARLLAESREIWPVLVEQLGIPFLPCGAVMVAVTDDEFETIRNEVYPKALKNGVNDVQVLTKDKVMELIPDVSADVKGGLLVPGESLVDPFWLTRAYAEAAVCNGAEVFVRAEVQGIVFDPVAERFRVATSDGREFFAKCVINAAGLWSDDVARLVGDESFTVTPRKGEFVLTEEELQLPHILLPVPSKISKGILVTPVVFGGYLLGPTAEEVEDKRDRSTTEEGLRKVMEGTAKLLPKVRHVQSIRQFAGNRAVSSTGDFIVRFSDVVPHFYHVAGIRSTGVSASPGLGRYVARDLAAHYGWEPRPDWRAELRLDTADVHASDEIVCLCRSITRGEIDRALCRPVAPTTIDGIKRRTGACLGDCQGNLCMPEIAAILADKWGVAFTDVQKHVEGSYLTVPAGEGRVKGR
jgi:glycerol-3-phosphate dehydrogenase